MDPPDPFMMAEAQALVRRFSLMPDMPLTVPLDLAGNVSIVGDREGVVAVARALLLQTAVLHAPEDVELAACFPPQAMADWEWSAGYRTRRAARGVTARTRSGGSRRRRRRWPSC